jgi:hypothetical protein
MLDSGLVDRVCSEFIHARRAVRLVRTQRSAKAARFLRRSASIDAASSPALPNNMLTSANTGCTHPLVADRAGYPTAAKAGFVYDGLGLGACRCTWTVLSTTSTTAHMPRVSLCGCGCAAGVTAGRGPNVDSKPALFTLSCRCAASTGGSAGRRLERREEGTGGAVFGSCGHAAQNLDESDPC